MRKFLLMAAALTFLPTAASAYVVRPFEGNDTGGIIAWSPAAHKFRHDIAADHCAQYGKMHRITSVSRRYGEYIGFACYWPRGYEPGRVIVRVKS